MKKKILFGIVMILGIVTVLSWNYLNQALKTSNNTEVKTIKINELKDGVYTGDYKIALSSAQVHIKIHQGSVVSIDLLSHEYGLGEKAETLTQTIIDQQSLQVDAVSGATISSKTILKAVENAMEKAQ